MSDVIDWLLDGAPGAQRPPDVLDQLCRHLIESGFPLDRAAVFVHVLHPQYVAYLHPLAAGPADRGAARTL